MSSYCNPGEHVWRQDMMICEICCISMEAVAAGRDRDPTWEDVDEAYYDGRRVGIELGRLLYKQERRRKLIEVGSYLMLRRLNRQIEDDAVKRAIEREEK